MSHFQLNPYLYKNYDKISKKTIKKTPQRLHKKHHESDKGNAMKMIKETPQK